VEDARWFQELANLRDSHGEPLTEEAHRACPGHAACLRHRWHHHDDGEDDGVGYRRLIGTVWICTDPQGPRPPGPLRPGQPASTGDASQEDMASAAERARAERQRVIANNKAWRSAETVRRAWLAQMAARKAPPPGGLRFLLAELARAHWTVCQSLGQGHQLAA
jgi:ParB family chromosome partitioning protein